ncbi:MAG: hypothetical protein MK066_12450 [Crocinitomicaceae bacterium]|nr:hypothetical protein [Crocinitomicaceae bacterium]
MEKRKTILDRESMSSEYIKGKQDFDNVLKAHKAMKPPLWKSAWFYGPVGLAVVAVTLSVSKLNTEKQIDDKKITFAQKSTVKKTTATYLAEAQSYPIIEEASKEEVIVPVKHEVKPPKIEAKEPDGFERTESIPEAPIVTVPPVKEKENKIKEVKETTRKSVKNMMPRIAGVFTGKISIDQLADENGLVSETCKIISYVIQYNNGEDDISERISGSKIPPILLMKLKRYNLNGYVFITQIRGVDEEGRLQVLPSMNLIPTLF